MKMHEPELSIIIPVYNTEKYLRACLDSIIAQTYSDYEVLLIDDGSTDRSGSICDEYAGLDNVHVIHTENLGVSHARNTGIDNAAGRYIYFIDSDDMLSGSEELQYMMLLAHSYPDVILRFRVNSILPNNNVRGGFLEKQIPPEKTASPGNRIKKIVSREHICSFVYGAFVFQFLIPANKLGHHRFNESFSLGEDVLFLSGLLTEAEAVIDCDRVVYYRMMREGSAVHSDMKPDYYENVYREYQIMEEQFSKIRGGSRVFNAIRADQTGAIQKISRNYKNQTENIRKARGMIMSAFPQFLLNRWMSMRTRIMLTAFLIDPKLFFKLYNRLRKGI